jgi:hypothetical protein
MEDKNIQLRELFENYEQLKDGNKDKLLMIGKKLLGIKKLVMNKNISGGKTGGLNCE